LAEGEVIQRGHLVLVALQGDYGKARPALVVQADIGADLPSVVLCPLTTTMRSETQFRLTIEPSSETGLRVRSQVMIEKIVAMPRSKVKGPIGAVDEELLAQATRALPILLGLV
jgi:mRNA interferase MazF